MKKIFMLAIITCIAIATRAQAFYGFEEAFVIMKYGDTVNCFIERAVAYDKTLKYKLEENAEPMDMQTKDIKAIILPQRYLLNIQLGEKERLMNFVTGTKAELYDYHILTKGPAESFGGGSMYVYNETVIYCVFLNNEYHEINKGNFLEETKILFADCSKLIEKINQKKYKLADLKNIVDTYEDCK